MAGYVATLANWDALLQDEYVTDGIREAVNDATPFQDKLERSGTTSGRRRVAPVQVGIAAGQGARAEGGSMPTYGAGEYVDATITSKYNYAPFKITGQAEEFGTERAFVEFGMRILKDTKQGFKTFTGRQCWGDGQGILALVNNGAGYAAGATSIAVDSAYGVLWGSLSTNTTFLLKRKMTVQFGTEDNNGAGYLVTLVGASSITIARSSTDSGGLVNAIADNAAITTLGSANLEIEGILAFAATAAFSTTLGISTTFHGINRTNYPEWEGNVLNAAAPLSLSIIRSMRDAIYKRTDDEESNLLMGGTEFSRDYEALLTPAMRLAPTKGEGGISSLSHDGLRVSKDSKAPAKAFFLADTKAVKWMQTRDPHWLQDGQGLMRVVAGQDAKEALLKWYSNLDVEEPRRMGICYNLTMS